MSAELKIREALDDLATGPVPADLADRALRGAARQRRTRIGASAVVAVTALGLAAAGFAFRGALGPSTAEPGDATASCVFLGGSGAVIPPQWPGPVRAVVAALPERYDYEMAYGYAWCARDDTVPAWDEWYGSYPAVMARMRVDRPRGIVLSIDIHLNPPAPPPDCDSVGIDDLGVGVPRGRAVEVCVESVGNRPLVLGGSGKQTDGRDGGSVWRTAVYPDGTRIALSAQSDLFTGEELQAAAIDPGVYAAIRQ